MPRAKRSRQVLPLSPRVSPAEHEHAPVAKLSQHITHEVQSYLRPSDALPILHLLPHVLLGGLCKANSMKILRELFCLRSDLHVRYWCDAEQLSYGRIPSLVGRNVRGCNRNKRGRRDYFAWKCSNR